MKATARGSSWVREADERFELPLPDGQRESAFVRAVWRDYARQHGAVTLDAADYRRLTGDLRLNDLAIWLAPGADAAAGDAAATGLAASARRPAGVAGRRMAAPRSATRAEPCRDAARAQRAKAIGCAGHCRAAACPEAADRSVRRAAARSAGGGRACPAASACRAASACPAACARRAARCGACADAARAAVQAGRGRFATGCAAAAPGPAPWR